MTDDNRFPSAAALAEQRTLFGHPAGLFTLFFAEMWERFSYYGMRALLVLYMTKGFLGYGDGAAYAVYGAYTALVYMTPFFGGMIADRLLGARHAVVWGGLLMATGHGLMGIEHEYAFFGALALLIAGNGFFKPNISTIVGTLYSAKSHKRDGGFTIFYIGINLGAAMSPLICGYIGEKYGWHRGFGLATIGMLAGVAVFVTPTRIAQTLIGLGASGAAFLLVFYHADDSFSIALNYFITVCLLGAAVVSCWALHRGGLPTWAGRPRDSAAVSRHAWKVYAGTLLLIPILVLLVSDLALVVGKPYSLIGEGTVAALKGSESKLVRVAAVFVEQVSKPAGLMLALAGLVAVVYLLVETIRMERVPRQRMYVAFFLIFFSMLFWAFFEQAGSSLNLFADRNVDRVSAERVLTSDDVGTTIEIQPTQEQLGYYNGEQLFTMDVLSELRNQNNPPDGDPSFVIDWVVTADNEGMVVAERSDEIPASNLQAINPIFILIFGLLFASLWTMLGRFEPSAPTKFGLGLLQAGLGFVAVWYGSTLADPRGMVALHWLVLCYLLHTTGELCLSPVGLSMMTKLAPTRLGSTVMGTWFLATAFSQYLAAIISQFTGVTGEEEGGNRIPPPSETLNVYGDVFGNLAIAAIVCAVVCFLLVPLLRKWMHEEETPSGG